MSAEVGLLREAAEAMYAAEGSSWPLVADWLDEAATELEEHIPAWTRPSAGVDDPPALCWNNPEKLAELVEHHYGRALAVARAFLRREAGETS